MGFDSRRGQFFFSEDRITGGVAVSIPDELRKKVFFGTVQPVQIGYVHLLFPTFSVQLICLGYLHYLSNLFPEQQFFEWGHILHLIKLASLLL